MDREPSAACRRSSGSRQETRSSRHGASTALSGKWRWRRSSGLDGAVDEAPDREPECATGREHDPAAAELRVETRRERPKERVVATGESLETQLAPGPVRDDSLGEAEEARPPRE